MTKEEAVAHRKEREEKYELTSCSLLEALGSLTHEQIEDLYTILLEDHILLYEALRDAIKLEKTIR